MSNVVVELLQNGMVEEIGHGPSRGEKRPILLGIVEDSRNLIGIDLGNSEFRGGIFNLRGRMLHNISLPVNAYRNEEAVDLVYELIDQLIAASSNTIVGIGVGTLGVTDTQRGVVFQAFQAGDVGVRQIIATAGCYLGIAIAHLAALLNVEHIVIGGRLALSVPLQRCWLG